MRGAAPGSVASRWCTVGPDHAALDSLLPGDTHLATPLHSDRLPRSSSSATTIVPSAPGNPPVSLQHWSILPLTR